jgi:glycosyltransferase involved in cell wall biosynthesis
MNDYLIKNPFVSIIIPCRNEEKYIGKCLDSILSQDYPKERLEVLVVDGMSEDKTRETIKNFQFSNPNFQLRLLDNPKKFTNFALNLGIETSKGDIILIAGAHATYEKKYISKCVKYLKEYNADNVGGIMKSLHSKNTVIEKSIALSISNPFGVGNAYYKSSYSKEPRWVDTVFGGCYKKEVFEKIGLFNENLVRNQDLEFNLRLRKAGGKILLVPDIVAYYYPKSNLRDFFIHNFRDGFWVTFPLKFRIRAFSWRHLMPLAFVLGLVGAGILGSFFPILFRLFLFIIGFYLLVNIYFALQISIKKKEIKYLFLMPIAFFCRHFGYGLGSIWGFLKVPIKNKICE